MENEIRCLSIIHDANDMTWVDVSSISRKGTVKSRFL